MILISVDPGTSTCGVAIWDIDDKTFKIKSVNSMTLVINRDLHLELRLKLLEERMTDIVSLYNPIQLIHESGFIDRFRPAAYGPIYAAIFLIRQSFRNVNLFKTSEGLFAYSPKFVKAAVSTGEADKFDMLDAVNNIDELKGFLIGNESEHAIDAIAIGYTHLKLLRLYPEMLLL